MSFSEFPTALDAVHLLVEHYIISRVDTVLATTIYSRVDCRPLVEWGQDTGPVQVSRSWGRPTSDHPQLLLVLSIHVNMWLW